VDPGGLSFASTAALALSDTAGRDVFIRVNRDLDYLPVLTLDQAYRWRTVLGTLQNSRDTQLSIDARQGFKTISTHIEALERLQTSLESDVQFGHLRNDFSRLHITEESWLPYGGLLISGLPGSTSLRPVVVAVRSSDVFEAIQAAHKSGPSFTLALGGPGQSLDEARLPGVKIDFAAVNAATIGLDLGNSYYILSILLLSLNLFGAYLLWRDTRRELRVAELRSQFVASVSHELKTPLTAIRMFGEILQTEKAVDAETHAECVDTIVNESERLTRLLNNVLDFSRIEHGQKSYRLESTLLSDVVAAAVKTMQYPLAEQGFDLKMEIDEDTPPVQADRDALKQAVLNLLTNAMKYSGESRDIALRLFRQNGNALIQVADRGIGIPAQEHSRIFEKFYRAAVQENLSISGTGLGLALVAHIVQGHGGTIQVESSPGVGSTFSICLPVHAVES
jgi:signal transduction histidine kinase